jgi:hypothetical protein
LLIFFIRYRFLSGSLFNLRISTLNQANKKRGNLKDSLSNVKQS